MEKFVKYRGAGRTSFDGRQTGSSMRESSRNANYMNGDSCWGVILFIYLVFSIFLLKILFFNIAWKFLSLADKGIESLNAKSNSILEKEKKMVLSKFIVKE